MNTQFKPWTRDGSTGFYNEQGERVCTGSQMGRGARLPADIETAGKLHLRRVAINSGGYDSGGAYWGTGQPLFCADGETATEWFDYYVRAYDREDAKTKVTARIPTARFYR